MNKGDKVYLPSGFVSNTFSMRNCVATVKYNGWVIDEFYIRIFIYKRTRATIIRIEGHICDLLLDDNGYQVLYITFTLMTLINYGRINNGKKNN